MGANLHILVVDDRPDSVLFLTEFLLSRQHRVETCNQAAEALEAVVRRHRTANAYDLLISDVSMPGMDGLTLVKEIRRRQLLLPIALYTAYGSMHPNLAQQAQQQGVLLVLDKPIELRRVENLLDTVVARRNGSQRVEKDQPFFGTSRVSRSPTTTTAYRRETAQPSDLDQVASGGYALEPKQVIPLPPSQPMSAPAASQAPIPLPPPPPSRIPPPIRTPLPFPVEQQEPHTRSMPSFRTPLPQDTRRESTGRAVNPNFRTPLPFLQPGAVPTAPVQPPMIPPSVASAPHVRSGPPPPMPVLPPGESGSPAQPPHQQPVTTRHTTSFVRRGVTPPVKETGGHARPPGIQPNPLPENNPAANPTGTARIRRTVTGSYAPSPISAGQNNVPNNQQQGPPGPPVGATRAVACAHCHKVFMVATRPDAYTAVCVHCGQLNRIDPL